MSRASAIRVGLQKYLIRTEAELEILRIDVLHGDDYEKRQSALQQMFVLVVERERTKMAYLQRLQALTAGKTAGEKKNQQSKVNDLNIEITVTPEDLTGGERP